MLTAESVLLGASKDPFSKIMASLDEDFDKACQFDIRDTKISSKERERRYGLYKQATKGNCTTTKPKFWQLTAVWKWKAWSAERDLTRDRAKQEYINLVEDIQLRAENSNRQNQNS